MALSQEQPLELTATEATHSGVFHSGAIRTPGTKPSGRPAATLDRNPPCLRRVIFVLFLFGATRFASRVSSIFYQTSILSAVLNAHHRVFTRRQRRQRQLPASVIDFRRRPMHVSEILQESSILYS